MNIVKDLNDMHKRTPEFAEFAVLYGVALASYQRIFYGVKMRVDLVRKAENKPPMQWKILRGKEEKYDDERKITKKFQKFCEERKNQPRFSGYEGLVESLFACCDARHALVHKIPEKAREIYFVKMQKEEGSIAIANYYKELTEMTKDPYEIITNTELQLVFYINPSLFLSPPPTNKS